MPAKTLFGTYIDINAEPINTIDHSPIYYGTIKSQGVFIANRLTAVIYKAPTDKTVIGKLMPNKTSKLSMQYKNNVFIFKNFFIGINNINPPDEADDIESIFNIYLTKHPTLIDASDIIQADKKIISKFNACFCIDCVPKILFTKQFSYGIFNAVVIDEYAGNNANYYILKAENSKMIILTVLCSVPDKAKGGILLNNTIKWIGKSVKIGYSEKGYLTAFNNNRAILFKHIKNPEMTGKVSDTLFDFFCRTMLNKNMDTVYQCQSPDTRIDKNLQSVTGKRIKPEILDILSNYKDNYLRNKEKGSAATPESLLRFGKNEVYLLNKKAIALDFDSILTIQGDV